MSGAHFALIPAAGSGARFGGAQPKQYHALHGRPMLEHTVAALAHQRAIESVFVVLSPGDREYARCRMPAGMDVVALFCGGPARACSVFNGLMAIRDRVEDDDWIWVHDAARPCVSGAELSRLLAALDDDDVGGLLALPLADTLKRADADDRVAATAPRDGLWRALTPQVFRYRLLVEALHRARGSEITDEAAAVERLGLRPRLVAGSAANIKVTYPEDLDLAAAILAQRENR
jgi:2-C-methyl-D-erythritol 4-phosphate cytidylyltransferase